MPPQIIVSTTYTGADAITIEQSVSTPLEQQMNGVDNMLYMQSTNANDGSEQLTVTFGIETDVNTDQVNVQNRVAQAQPNLPTDVNQYRDNDAEVHRASDARHFALSRPTRPYDSLFLANYANININDVLYRVPGVGEVRVFGASDYAMRIWVKPDVLSKLGLAVPDLANAVRQQSNVNPSGQVGAEPAPEGMEKTYTVRAQGRLQTPEEFGQIVVRSNPDGSVVRLKDVARIELGALNYQQSSRMNGQPSAIIAVFQAPGSNALAVADGVKKTMAELKGRFPADLDYVVALDTTLPVTEGIREIVQTLIEAMILVIIVVFLFLQNWRATLIPMIAVPVSLDRHLRRLSLVGFLDQHAVAVRLRARDRSGRGRRDCGRGSGRTSHRGGNVAARGHDPGDEGGLGAGDRHCADPLFGLPAGGVYGRHSGAAEQSVRGDDCDLRAHFGLQRADPLAGALRAAAQAAEGIERHSRPVLRRLQPGV